MLIRLRRRCNGKHVCRSRALRWAAGRPVPTSQDNTETGMTFWCDARLSASCSRRRDGGVSVCAPSLSGAPLHDGVAAAGRMDSHAASSTARLPSSPRSVASATRIASSWPCSSEDARTPKPTKPTPDRFCVPSGVGHRAMGRRRCPLPIVGSAMPGCGRTTVGRIGVDLSKARGANSAGSMMLRGSRTTAGTGTSILTALSQPDWSVLRDAIRRAADVGDLRRVWPSELS